MIGCDMRAGRALGLPLAVAGPGDALRAAKRVAGRERSLRQKGTWRCKSVVIAGCVFLIRGESPSED